MVVIYIKGSQREILQHMQRAGFNVCTCGSCGGVVLQEGETDTLTCPMCGLESDASDFPDLYTVEGKA